MWCRSWIESKCGGLGRRESEGERAVRSVAKSVEAGAVRGLMSRLVLFGVLASVLGCVLAVTSVGAPLPDPVPRKWELRFEPGELRTAVVSLPDAGPTAFYYMTYYVENNTGDDLYFAPRFELVTDAGEVMRSGREVPREAVDKILAILDEPLLLDEIRVQGNLLQGPENAREALVVWPVGSLDVDEVSVYAAGFSGENEIVQRPDTGETVVLRKTKMLRHLVPGTLNPRRESPLRRTVERWILR